MKKEKNTNEQIEVTEQIGEVKKETKKRREKPARSADVIRRLRHGRTATVITAAVVVVAILFNFAVYLLGERFPLSFDTSADQLFTLSDTSIKLAESVQNPIEIVVMASEETFSDSTSAAAQAYSYGYEQVSRALTEFYNATKLYNTYSGGKVTTTYIDLNREPAKANAYANIITETMEEGNIYFINGKRYKTANINNDLYSVDSSSYYTDGTMTFDSIVELTLATKIKSVQSTTDYVITTFTGHGEDTSMIESIEKLYSTNGFDMKRVDFTKSAKIDENTVCAVIAAPSKDFTAEEIKRLQDWLDNNGKEGRALMVFAHPTAKCTNLFEFLKVEYGMEVTDNIVTETDFDRQESFNPYYVFGDVPETDFTKGSVGSANIITWTARQIIPHWKSQEENKTQYSANLITYADTAELTPLSALETEDENATVDSHKYDGTIVGMAIAVNDGFQNALQSSTSTKVAVCGSAYAIYNYHTQKSTNDNEELFLDTMSALTGLSDSVNLTAKPLTAETISFSASAQIFVGLGLFTVALPIGLLICGLVIFLKRRHL